MTALLLLLSFNARYVESNLVSRSVLNANVLISTNCGTTSSKLHRPKEIGCVVTFGWVLGIALLKCTVVVAKDAVGIEGSPELAI